MQDRDKQRGKMKKSYRVVRFGRVVLLLSIATALVHAQAPDTLWTKTYGGINHDYGFSVQQTYDGGYIIVGRTRSFGAGDYDVWLLKTDSLGDTLWTKTYGGAGFDEAWGVQQTADGGYIVVGESRCDVYLIKTDSLGNTLWTKTYGSDSTYEIGYSVQQTPDGGYIIAGEIGIPTIEWDVYLVKTDSLGDTLWTRTYGGIDHEYDWGNAVLQASDSGYIVVGMLSWHVGLIKTDSSGDTLWTQIYGTDLSEGRSIQQTPDGGYIIVGIIDDFGDLNVFFIKTDTDGDTIWTRTYGGTNDDRIWGRSSVDTTADGGYIVTGGTQSFGAGLRDVWLLKIHANGDTLWTRTYGGTDNDLGYSVQQTYDGGYIIVGRTQSFGAGGRDVWLLKTEPDVGIEEHQTPRTKSQTPIIEVFPNPFSKLTYISFGKVQSAKIVELKIYDATGRVVKVFNHLTNNQIFWNGTDNLNRRLPSGVYFVRLQAGDYSATEKVLLIK
jgi:hypothetical protein